MKLNPNKCAFSIALGKFLGFMVSQRGIEANLEKVQAILDMASPKTVKEVPKNQEDCICVNSSLAQAASILLGEPHLGNDGSTHQKVHEQTWSIEHLNMYD